MVFSCEAMASASAFCAQRGTGQQQTACASGSGLSPALQGGSGLGPATQGGSGLGPASQGGSGLGPASQGGLGLGPASQGGHSCSTDNRLARVAGEWAHPPPCLNHLPWSPQQPACKCCRRTGALCHLSVACEKGHYKHRASKTPASVLDPSCWGSASEKDAPLRSSGTRTRAHNRHAQTTHIHRQKRMHANCARQQTCAHLLEQVLDGAHGRGLMGQRQALCLLCQPPRLFLRLQQCGKHRFSMMRASHESHAT